MLEKIVFPSIVAEKRLRGKEFWIWSAACASGQEPYSLAMLLEENEKTWVEPVHYRIIASDKSKVQIEHARQGLFCSFNLGHVSMNRLLKCFEVENPYSVSAVRLIRGKLREKY